MDNKNAKKNDADYNLERTYDGRYGNDGKDSTPGINTPGIELPAFNPPIPNRAWTAMRMGVDIDDLSEEEKKEMYLGNDDIM